MKVWLVLMILDVGSGEVLQEAMVQEFDTAEACVSAQTERGVRRPLDGLIAIYDCRQMR